MSIRIFFNLYLLFFSCIFFYPAFFWVSLFFIITAIAIFVKFEKHCGYLKNSPEMILMPGVCLYLISFFCLHLLKYEGIVKEEIGFSTLLMLATLSIALIIASAVSVAIINKNNSNTSP